MMDNKKYKITNTTVKPLRRNKSGKDLRTTVEKVGHPVSFRDSRENSIIIPVGRSRIVEDRDVGGGLLGLQRGGFVSITEIKNIGSELKKYTLENKKKKSKKSSKKKDDIKETDNKTGVRAVEMGRDDYSQEGGNEHEGAVNPDGNPDFVVKAKSKNSNSEGETLDVSNTGSNREDEESSQVS